MLIYCPGCDSLVAPYWETCRTCGARVDDAKSMAPRMAPAPLSGPEVGVPTELPPRLDADPGPTRSISAYLAGISFHLPQGRILLHPPAGLRVALTAVAVFALFLSAAVWAATRSGDSSAFYPRNDRTLAALQIRTTATPAKPTATNTAPPVATTAPTEEPAQPTADAPANITPAPQPVADEPDEGPSGRGRGNGPGRGHEDEGSDD